MSHVTILHTDFTASYKNPKFYHVRVKLSNNPNLLQIFCHLGYHNNSFIQEGGRESRDDVFNRRKGLIDASKPFSQTNRGGSEHKANEQVREQQAGAQRQRACISRDKHQSLSALIDSAVETVLAGTVLSPQ